MVFLHELLKNTSVPMSKAIKKISTILLIVVAGSAAMLALISLLLNTSPVRTTAGKMVADAVSSRTGLCMSVGSARFSLWGALQMDRISVADTTGRTIATCANATANLALRSLWLQKPIVNSLHFDSLSVSLQLNHEGDVSMEFSLPKSGEQNIDNQEKLAFEIETVSAARSEIIVTTAENHRKVYLADLELEVTDIFAEGENIIARLNHLSFSDQITMRKAQAFCKVEKLGNRLNINKLTTIYGSSQATVDSVRIDFEALQKPSFTLKTIDAQLSANEAHLVWSEAPNSLDIQLKANVMAADNELHVNDILLSVGEQTTLSASLAIYDYADTSQCYVSGRVRRAETTVEDMAELFGVTAVSEQMQNIGLLRFSAAIEGHMSDAKLDAALRTNVGVVKANLRTGLDAGELFVRGRLLADNLTLVSITNNIVGNLQMVANLDMRLRGDKSLRFANATIVSQEAEINGYNYHNITARCRTDRNHLVAALEVRDPSAHIIVGGGGDLLAQNKYYAVVAIDSLLTEPTKLTDFLPKGKLNANFDVKLDARSLDDANAFARITNIGFTDGVRTAHADSLVLDAQLTESGSRRIDVRSDLISGTIAGHFDYADIVEELRNQLSTASRSICDSGRVVPAETNLAFSLEYDNVEQFMQFYASDIRLGDKGTAQGHLRAMDHNSRLSLNIGDVAYGDVALQNLVAEFQLFADSATTNVTADMLTLPAIGDIGKFEVDAVLHDDSLALSLDWLDSAFGQYSGTFASLTAFGRNEADKLYATTHIWPSQFVMKNKTWYQSEALVHIGSDEANVSGFMVSQDDKHIGIEGSTADTLRIDLKHLELSEMFRETPYSKFALAGSLTSTIKITDTFGEMSADCVAGIDSFYVNHDWLDHLDVTAQWQPAEKQLALQTAIVSAGRERARGIGRLEQENNYFDLMFDIDSVSIGFLNFYLNGCVSKITGTSSGWLRLHGPLSDIEMDAHLGVNRSNFRIRQTGVDYVFDSNDTIVISPTSIDFCDLRFSDQYGKRGVFSGNIAHDMFVGLRLNILFAMRDQLAFNLSAKESPTFYGPIFANGTLNVTGTTSLPHLEIDAYTCDKTDFYILPLEKSDLSQTSYIKFRMPDDMGAQLDKHEIEDLLSSVTAHMNVDIRPESQIHLVVDEKTGNMMTVRGNALLGVDIDRAGDLFVQGKYEVDEGVYSLSLEKLLVIPFVINKGSVIEWDDGNPYNAILDVVGTHKVKASLYDLVRGTTDLPTSDIKRRVPINCNLLLSGRLVDPLIKFNIEIPSSLNFSQYIFDQYVTSEEEMNRQAISLLLTNRFYPVENSEDNSSTSGINISQTASDYISRELSKIISQNKYNIGIGVNYRPGDEISNEEYEVSFSTQLFNNKMVVSGNVGYGRDVKSSEQGTLIGDFDVEMKLNERGNLRAKAYTHSNNDVIYEQSPTTQGIGLSYSDEFDSVRELVRRYWYAISGQRRRDRKAAQAEADKQKKESTD